MELQCILSVGNPHKEKKIKAQEKKMVATLTNLSESEPLTSNLNHSHLNPLNEMKMK